MPTQTESQTTPAAVAKIDIQAITSSPKAQRIPALDFTKGALVLLMVFYHWVNYFIGPQWGYYQYLRFLTPSFIFITGFLISNVYLSKYAADDSRLPKRLFIRGSKLLAIFLVLNLARVFVIPILGTGTLVSDPLTAKNMFAIFVSGNLPLSSVKLAAFPILIPIGYLLIIAGALIIPYRRNKYTFHLVCAALLISILIFALDGTRSFNLEFLAIGLLGVVIGFAQIGAIDNLVRHQYSLAFVYLCDIIAVTIWNVPFPLVVFGVLVNLAVIYLIGVSGGQFGIIKREIILLGKYSLFGYISQIAILQILSAAFHRMIIGPAILVMSFVAAFTLTILSVRGLDIARTRNAGVDMFYRTVFA